MKKDCYSRKVSPTSGLAVSSWTSRDGSSTAACDLDAQLQHCVEISNLKTVRREILVRARVLEPDRAQFAGGPTWVESVVLAEDTPANVATLNTKRITRSAPGPVRLEVYVEISEKWNRTVARPWGYVHLKCT